MGGIKLVIFVSHVVAYVPIQITPSANPTYAIPAASSTASRAERIVSSACGRSLWMQHVNGLLPNGTFASFPLMDVTISEATTLAVLDLMSDRGTLPAVLLASK